MAREPVVERYEGLEASTANIRRLIGDDAAGRLSRAFGGRRLYVPRSPGEHHPISAAIGHAAAAKLAGAFHGVSIDIPMAPDKQARILQLDGQGWTRAAIAREVGCTERWVYMTLEKKNLEPSAQGRLF